MINLVHFTTVFKCRMPNMSFVVVVSCSSMYESYCLLLRGKNLNILAILRKKLCLKYQNLPIFAEKQFIEADSIVLREGNMRYRQRGGTGG